MGNLYQLQERLLADDRITADEVEVIHNYIHEDGELDMEDLKFLVNLLSSAREVCSEFDDLFFPTLKQIVLADGKIGSDEQFYLLKMLYSDGLVRDVERDFLFELRNEATDVPPEFEALCEEILTVPDRNWDVGGVPR